MSYNDKKFVYVSTGETMYGIGLFFNLERLTKSYKQNDIPIINPFYNNSDATLLQIPQLWKGNNLLGDALTETRDILIQIQTNYGNKISDTNFKNAVIDAVNSYEQKMQICVDKIIEKNSQKFQTREKLASLIFK